MDTASILRFNSSLKVIQPSFRLFSARLVMIGFHLLSTPANCTSLTPLYILLYFTNNRIDLIPRTPPAINFCVMSNCRALLPKPVSAALDSDDRNTTPPSMLAKRTSNSIQACNRCRKSKVKVRLRFFGCLFLPGSIYASSSTIWWNTQALK